MTNWPDAVNGCLELCGAAMLAANVRAVRRDKQIMGVHWAPTVFFTVWGLWNLYFYPSLDQWMSFTGGLAMVVVNALWLGHVWFYWRRTKVEEEPSEPVGTESDA